MDRARETRKAYKTILGKPDGRNDMGQSRVDGKIILKWIGRTVVRTSGLDLPGSGEGCYQN
jgi:hypothetical protein